MKELIKLSRELVENLLDGNKKKLGKEYYLMFTISKFILLKERILKKDSANKILYFNNVKYAKYIPAILSFADEIKKNGDYKIDNTSIMLKENNIDSQKLTESLWLFNKVRDSLAHGQYTIDLENDSLLINNDHSNCKDNSYKLICSIPIELLNSISFYIEKVDEKPDAKELSKAYREYLEEIAANYDVDDRILFNDNYINNINKYYDNKYDIINNNYDNKYDIINNNYDNKYDNLNNNYDNKYDIINNNYDNKYFGNNKYLNNDKYFGNNKYLNNDKYFDNDKYLNNDKYYDNNKYLNNDKYFGNNKYLNNDKYFDNDKYLNNDKYYDNNKYLNNEKYYDNNKYYDNEIKKLFNNLTIKELQGLVEQLLEYKPRNEKQKEQTNQIIRKFKSLEVQKIEKQEEFDAKTSDLMREISDILGIKVGTKNSNAAIALYMYMNLVFSQNNEIDYSHICLRDLLISVNPYKYTDKVEEVSNSSDDRRQKIINFEKNYIKIKNYINKLCVEFSEKMDTRIEAYYNNPSENFRYSLMNNYAEFYTLIMNSIGNRNQLIITSLRNSVEHGNYLVRENGYLGLYDQIDHSDDKDIKILCGALPQQLFNIIKTIELSNSKDKYIMDDFFKELETIIDKTLLNNVMNTMNNLSKITFGKDIDANNSMEHMYQESIADAISQHISKK